MPSNQPFEIEKIQLGKSRRHKDKLINVMVFQTEFVREDFEIKKGLLYHKNIAKAKNYLFSVLKFAQQKNINLIVFPELSIPEELLPLLVNWSKCNHELIIIGGSHYHKNLSDVYPISRSPVIHNGKIYFSEKIYPAPAEQNSNEGWGIGTGTKILSFTESPIGKFIVLICSDNLVPDVREIIKYEDYDFLIVPAFQKDSIYHWNEIWADVNTGNKPLFAIYANNKSSFLEDYTNKKKGIPSDGRSSFWGRATSKAKDDLKEGGMTDFEPNGKLCEISNNNNYFKLTVNISAKSPNLQIGVVGKEELLNIYDASQGRLEIPDRSQNEWPLEQIEYEYIRQQFTKIEDDPASYSNFIYPRILEQIEHYLEKYGVVFITGPIQIGKTSMLLSIAHSLKHRITFIPTINGKSVKAKIRKIKEINEFYYSWYTEITEHLLASKSMHRHQIADEKILAMIEDEEDYYKWFDDEMNVGEKGIHIFLRILDEFKRYIGYKTEVIVGITLDDIHKQVNDAIFTSLKEDIISLKLNPLNKLGVKLIVASRYLPSTVINKEPVVLLPCFDEYVIHGLVSLLNEEMDDTTLRKFVKLLLNRTDGYPWFVMRFFKIYLKHRIDGNKNTPLLLFDEIFTEQHYWLTDAFFSRETPSSFLIELKELIRTVDIKTRKEFEQFIISDSEATILNNAWNNSNNFLIRQSGFYKINPDSESFENNGCFVLSTHFKNYILSNGSHL